MNSKIETNATNTADKKRYNRVQIEWAEFLSPIEYMVLDKMLFQSNLTKANDGDGYHFHVRQLARELNLDDGYLSQVLKRWPFIHKQGKTKAMVIVLDYAEFTQWIAALSTNDCCLTSADCCQEAAMIAAPGQPISNSKKENRKETKKTEPLNEINGSGRVATGVATTPDKVNVVEDLDSFGKELGLTSMVATPIEDWDSWFNSSCTESPIEKQIEAISNISPLEIRRAKLQGAPLQSALTGIGNNNGLGLATPAPDQVGLATPVIDEEDTYGITRNN